MKQKIWRKIDCVKSSQFGHCQAKNDNQRERERERVTGNKKEAKSRRFGCAVSKQKVGRAAKTENQRVTVDGAVEEQR
jgi:hypothetical protein